VKTILITETELAEIANRDESHFFDTKQYDVSGKSIQKIAVAFSNADGGELIVGIKDKKLGGSPKERWEAIGDIEKLNGHLLWT
jgi:ATP-dependent DNA helicase RecG